MSKFFEKFIRPILFSLPAETAHEMGIEALRTGLVPRVPDVHFAEIERFGLKFRNPFGIAAGFDKNGEVVDQLAKLGFGFVEVGTVTYEPQPGNEKPRLFRLPEDKALINRLGFNNDGAERIAERLRKIGRKCVVGVNIGKNKNVPIKEAVENYLACFEVIHPVVDYIAVNISSPNTPNLRDLQKAENLEELLGELHERNRVLSLSESTTPSAETAATPPNQGGELKTKPLLVKIAPDLSEGETEAIVDLCVRFEIAGIIATNTTISREGLKTKDPEKFGNGGLSGNPLASRSNEIISRIFRYSKGQLPVIGVGGIFDATDAFEKIAAGACLVQAYTGFIYGGPSFANDINSGLSAILKEKGFSHLDEAIGSSVK